MDQTPVQATIAALRESLESGEFLYSSKVESRLIDVERAVAELAEPSLLAIASRLANEAGETKDIRLAQAARLVAEVVEGARPEERTPEMVLLAMARAYGDAEADAHIILRRTHSADAGARAAFMYAARAELISEAARATAPNYRPSLIPRVLADYQARRRGERDLFAPPVES